MDEREIMIQKIRPEITECRILQIEKLDDEDKLCEEKEDCCTKR